MTPAYRLLALDLDGTLLDDAKRVTARTRRALAAARRLGVRVVLVTGRRWAAAVDVAGDLAVDALALHNGSVLVEAGRVLRCLRLPRAAAVAAVEAGRAANQSAVLLAGEPGAIAALVEAEPSVPRLRRYLELLPGGLRRVPDLVEALAQEPLQALFGGPCEAIGALRTTLESVLQGCGRVERTLYREHDLALLDVLHTESGKAHAVAFLCVRWAVPAREVLAIGDNWNDLEMLEQAGLGLVMGNAEPALRSRGLPVLPDNEHDGVAVGLERHVLGDA